MNSQTDKPLRILSAVDLHNINEAVTTQPSMIRDHQVLQSAVRRPYLILFGEEQFPGIEAKAAVTLHSLAAHHIFIDGNKRTAIRAAEMFLEMNGLRPTWTDEEVRAFALQIARGAISVDAAVEWVSARVEELHDDST